ncbi:hypothetical protein [Kitasatospora sp. NPDC058046]|uniref:hypothetical protein n=1 Tax=Kitasatospora sp. NPDC058046 TaxID=3346312 RepID=UPI0036DA181D
MTVDGHDPAPGLVQVYGDGEVGLRVMVMVTVADVLGDAAGVGQQHPAEVHGRLVAGVAMAIRWAATRSKESRAA